MELSALGEHRASLHVLFAPERAMPRLRKRYRTNASLINNKSYEYTM